MARTLFAENVELYFYWCWDAQTIRSLYGRSEDYLAVFILWFDLIPQCLDIVSNLWDVNLVEELMTMMVGDDFYPPAIDSDDLRIDVVTDCYKMLFELMLLLIVRRQKQQPDSYRTWREPTKPTTSECKDLWKRRGSPWIKRQICLKTRDGFYVCTWKWEWKLWSTFDR